MKTDIYELRDINNNLVAKGSLSFCNTRLFQKTGKISQVNGWVTRAYILRGQTA